MGDASLAHPTPAQTDLHGKHSAWICQHNIHTHTLICTKVEKSIILHKIIIMETNNHTERPQGTKTINSQRTIGSRFLEIDLPVVLSILGGICCM